MISDNRGSTSAWTWLAVIVVPLVTLCLGGLTYWVRKIDDIILTPRMPPRGHPLHHFTACCICEKAIVAPAKWP